MWTRPGHNCGVARQRQLPSAPGAPVRYTRAAAGALPFPDAAFDAAFACLVFEHIEGTVDALAEVGRVLRPKVPSCSFLNHPLLQAPGSGWVDDHILEEQYWRIGPYLVEHHGVEEVDKNVWIPFVHRPLSVYVNGLAAAGLYLTGMVEPAPPAGFLEKAARVPRGGSFPPALSTAGREAGAPPPRTRHEPGTLKGMAEFVVITGLSGAGRSQAGAALEDLGWYVMDNLPTALITKVADLVSTGGPEAQRLALVVGRHAGQLGELQTAVQQLRASGERVSVLFLEASDEVLVRRFEGTRRRHPLGQEGVLEAIVDERRRLDAMKEMADVVVDTTDLNVNQLRERLADLFSGEDASAMQILVLSFGYKHGVPLDVDNVFDVRFLPNPHWVESMRPLTGLDEPVRRYVLGQPAAKEFLERVGHLLKFLVPAYTREGRSYLTIAIGCTGGRHRSVVLAEEIAARLREMGFTPSTIHRDVER